MMHKLAGYWPGQYSYIPTIKGIAQEGKNSFYQKSPCFRGVGLWDTLTKEVQKIPTKAAFKAKIETLLLNLPPH